MLLMSNAMPANMPMVLPPNQSSWRSVEMKLLTRLRGPCRIDPAAEAPDLNKDSRVVSRAKCIEDAIFIIVVVMVGGAVLVGLWRSKARAIGHGNAGFPCPQVR